MQAASGDALITQLLLTEIKQDKEIYRTLKLFKNTIAYRRADEAKRLVFMHEFTLWAVAKLQPKSFDGASYNTIATELANLET